MKHQCLEAVVILKIMDLETLIFLLSFSIHELEAAHTVTSTMAVKEFWKLISFSRFGDLEAVSNGFETVRSYFPFLILTMSKWLWPQLLLLCRQHSSNNNEASTAIVAVTGLWWCLQLAMQRSQRRERRQRWTAGGAASSSPAMAAAEMVVLWWVWLMIWFMANEDDDDWRGWW